MQERGVPWEALLHLNGDGGKVSGGVKKEVGDGNRKRGGRGNCWYVNIVGIKINLK